MIGRLLAAAAFSAVLTGTALAQMAAPPASNPTASPSANDASHAVGSPTPLNSSQPATSKPAPSNPTMSQHSAAGSGMSATKQTAQGHEQENGVADKLNACEAKPMTERQACFDAATRR